MLDQKMKDCRCEASMENLQLMQSNWNLFMQRIVTGEETWIHVYTTMTLTPNKKAAKTSRSAMNSLSNNGLNSTALSRIKMHCIIDNRSATGDIDFY
jgi:hypothetical protein